MEMSEQAMRRLQTAFALTIMLIIVTASVTLVYWAAGGEFERSPAAAVGAMVMVYLWTLCVKVAVEKHKEGPEAPCCKVCGFHPNSRRAQLNDQE